MNVAIDYQAILSKALSGGGEFADIFVERSIPFSIICEDGKIEKVISGFDYGAGVRLIFGQRTAYAYTKRADNRIAFGNRRCSEHKRRRRHDTGRSSP